MSEIIKIIRENSNYFEDFITRSTYHSTHIEGNTLTYGETYALLFNDNSFNIQNTKPREIYEAINHKMALSYVMDNVDQELSLDFIKNIGIKINHNINDISDFRKVNVAIQGVEYIPPSPVELRNQLYYFIDNYNNTDFENIFEKIAHFHIQFERLHPFEDGNGRSGRLLINYELLKADMLPLVILNDDKNKYFDFLSKQDTKGLSEFFNELHEYEKERATSLGLKTVNNQLEQSISSEIEKRNIR